MIVAWSQHLVTNMYVGLRAGLVVDRMLINVSIEIWKYKTVARWSMGGAAGFNIDVA